MWRHLLDLCTINLMNWKKLLLWVGVAIVGLLVIAIILIKILVSPASIAAQITPRLEQAFNCPVQVGETELTIFSGVGVRIHDVTVQNPPPFANSSLATVAMLDARLKVLPLLFGSVRLKEIDIVGSQLFLLKDSAGANNLSALSLQRLRDVSQDEEDKQLLCRRIRFHDGRILYRNDSTGTRLVLGKLDVDLNIGTGAQPRFQSDVRLDSLFLWSSVGNYLISPSAAELSLQGSYALASDSLIINRCDWRLDKIVGRLEGAIARPTGDPYFNLHLTSEHTDLVDCYDSRLIAGIPVLRDMNLAGDLRIDISLRGVVRDSRTTTVRGKVSVTDMQATLPDSDVRLKAKLLQSDFNEASMSLFAEEAHIGAEPASMRIAIDNFREPTISGEVRLACGADVLARLLGFDSSKQFGGDVRATLSGFVKTADRDQARFFGSISLDNFSFRDQTENLTLDGVGLDLNLAGNDADLSRFDLDLGGYKLQLNGRLTDFAPYVAAQGKPTRRPRFEFAGSADSLSLALFARGHRGANDTTSILRMLDVLADFDSRGTLRIGNCLVGGMSVRDFDARINVVNRIVSTDALSCKLFDREAQADVVVDLNNLLQPEFDIDYSAEKVEANDLLSGLTGFSEHLYGRMEIQASFEGRGLLREQILSSLKAKGKVTMEDGEVLRLKAANALTGKFGIISLPDDEFDELQADFSVENESLLFNSLTIKEGKLVYQIEGAVDFDGGYDCRATRTLSKDDVRTLSERPEAGDLANGRSIGKAIFRLAGDADTAFAQLEALLPKD